MKHILVEIQRLQQDDQKPSSIVIAIELRRDRKRNEQLTRMKTLIEIHAVFNTPKPEMG